MQQFQAQRHRGTEGFGLFDGRENNIVRATKEKKILKWLRSYESNLLMFHHRFPTSTVNVKRAAHPFSTGNYFGKTQYILVHNGSIRNSDELFCDHQELGINYTTLLQDLTFNDSEALLWDFALYMEGKQKEFTARGKVAFVCVKLVKGKLEKLYFGRNSNPLNMLRTKDGIKLSSEGEGEPITPDMLYTYNYKLKRLTSKKLTMLEFKPLPAYAGNSWGNYTPSNNYVRQSYSPYADSNYDDYSGEPDDDERYRNWWESQDAQKAGGWLGDHLREKFDHFFNADGSVKNVVDRNDKSQLVDYEKSESGLFVPSNRKMQEHKLISLSSDYPTEDEVQTEAMAYLAAVQGHFEQAYWAVEGDYSVAEDLPETRANIRTKVLLDLILQYLDNDPEYENEESVSSIWEAIWQKQAV